MSVPLAFFGFFLRSFMMALSFSVDFSSLVLFVSNSWCVASVLVSFFVSFKRSAKGNKYFSVNNAKK